MKIILVPIMTIKLLQIKSNTNVRIKTSKYVSIIEKTRKISVGRGIGVVKILNLNSRCFSRKLPDDRPLGFGRRSSG